MHAQRAYSVSESESDSESEEEGREKRISGDSTMAASAERKICALDVDGTTKACAKVRPKMTEFLKESERGHHT